MADRSIVVRLRAEVTDYKRAMAEAATATDRVGGAGLKSSTSLGRMVESAQKNRAEWTTAGQTFLAVGGAITAVGVAALRTGISYNTLQQTSRAALTTLLGSAEAANAQMDKLDDFARTSPFAKQAFINAQRQMLGFGIEAQKVIPYLDAIQNAVAAMGGSNHDISELSRIISQISASAKITATDLREFGNRGVDAATIIGSQMGKTGAQIRNDITAGTLDAQAALDALAAGMQDRFGGAAENVKNTFEGSIDRVKAAWRDLASELATPLVDPNGGGALIDMANELADIMRAVQALPEPVKAAMLGIAGLTGAASLAAGTFLLALPRLIETRAAFATLAQVSPGAAAGIGKVGGALGSLARAGVIAASLVAVAAATSMLIDELIRGDSVLGANALEKAIGDAVSAGDVSALTAQFQNFGNVLGAGVVTSVNDLGSALDRALERKSFTQTGWLVQETERLVGVLPGVTSSLERVEGRFASLDATLAGMVAAGDIGAVRDALALIYDEAEGKGYSIEQVNGLFTLTQDALVGVEDAAPGAAEGIGTVGGEAELAAEKFEKWLEVVGAANAAFIDIQGAYDTAAAAAEEFGESAGVSATAYIDALEAQVAAQEAWETNMVTIAERVNSGMTGEMRVAARAMIDELLALGPEGAEQVQLLATMTDAELSEVVRLWSNKGEAAVTEFNGRMAKLQNPTLTLDINTTAAYARVTSFINDVNGRIVSLNAAGQQVGFQMPNGRKGFAEGGYTGNGGVLEPAGVVHGKEFVINARATAANRGLLEAINRGVPGYSAGGFVAPQYMSAPPAGSGSGASRSLAGLAIEGSLDLGGGLVGTIRGVVASEMSHAQASRTSAAARGVR